ncbi:hypothetical protein QL285_067286 [Trifolium repens]|nr:hypothetical protein QL285_067286 [Trifolium repens]
MQHRFGTEPISPPESKPTGDSAISNPTNSSADSQPKPHLKHAQNENRSGSSGKSQPETTTDRKQPTPEKDSDVDHYAQERTDLRNRSKRVKKKTASAAPPWPPDVVAETGYQHQSKEMMRRTKLTSSHHQPQVLHFEESLELLRRLRGFLCSERVEH